MRKWIRIALGLLVIVVIAGVVWSGWLAEPVYDGKRLSKWLRTYDLRTSKSPPETDEAIRAIGTNAIPELLRMLQPKDSELRLKLIALLQKQHLIKFNFLSVEERRYEAAEAFRALGGAASNAVPGLIKMYPENVPVRPPNQSEKYVLKSLGYIGPAAKGAIPLLMEVAANRDDVSRFFSVEMLGLIHSEPATVMPLFVEELDAPTPGRRAMAVQSIGFLGADARPETSRMLKFLQDQEIMLRYVALRALSDMYQKPEWKQRANSIIPAKKYQPADLIGVINDFGSMGTNAVPAVPALVKFLSDPDDGVRASATNALKSIDRESAANAGVR